MDPFSPSRRLRQGDHLSLTSSSFVLSTYLISSTSKWSPKIGFKASPNGPSFSHLFFDDLVLFANTNESSCITILSMLNNFCKASEQKVNFHKSKIFCSLNIPKREAQKFSNMCGMALSNDLGMYLGVPLIHGRFNHFHCNYVVEKVQKRLAGWKASCLSFAGKRTLVQAVTSTISNYAM